MNTVVLEKQIIAHRSRMSVLDLAGIPVGDVKAAISRLAEDVQYDLEVTVLSHTYSLVPASWWDHLKRDHAPAWFTRWYPVKYHKVSLVVRADPHRICQEIDRANGYPMVEIDISPTGVGHIANKWRGVK